MPKLLRKKLKDCPLELSGSEIYSEGLTYAAHRMKRCTLFQMDARRMPDAHLDKHQGGVGELEGDGFGGLGWQVGDYDIVVSVATLEDVGADRRETGSRCEGHLPAFRGSSGPTVSFFHCISSLRTSFFAVRSKSSIEDSKSICKRSQTRCISFSGDFSKSSYAISK